MGINERLKQEIVDIAKKHGVKKVILFGSRSRDDYKNTSDIDLAVSGGNIAAFAMDLEEDTSTLLEYDIVNLDGRVQAELVDSIKSEGKIIYEEV